MDRGSKMSLSRAGWVATSRHDSFHGIVEATECNLLEILLVGDELGVVSCHFDIGVYTGRNLLHEKVYPT